jgi:hypothetical protein
MNEEVRRMGYIAPMTNYQYTQYAERDVTNHYDPYHITPINRTKPLMNTNPNQSKGVRAEKLNKQKRSSVKKLSKESAIGAIYSELTGKGRYFNECV